MLTQAIKGVKDILPEDVGRWQRLEAVARELFETYGFSEIRVPIIEHTVLFSRSIGATSDIVEKEMYAFRDAGGDEITIRPEGTAGVVRAVVEHKLYAKSPLLKLYYMGPMFRRERPQAGRFRQFHQVGLEAIGHEGPEIDVEVLALLSEFFERLGVKGVELQINTLGCGHCRPRYREALKDFLVARKEKLCDDCQRRIEANPLRALDCKSERCKEATHSAPAMQDFLDDDCKSHFTSVKKGLDDLDISYSINPRMVRGLDYYTRTAFEMVMTDKKGAQNAVAAGGRYDGLVGELGGPQTPGIGFAIGLERLIGLMPGNDGVTGGPELYVAALGSDARRIAQRLVNILRKNGIRADWDLAGAGLKSQMKKADKAGVSRVLIIGEDELADGYAVLRDMNTREQEKVGLDELPQSLIGRLVSGK